MRLFRAETLKLRRRMATYVILVVLLVVVALLYLLTAATMSATDPVSRTVAMQLFRFPNAYLYVLGFIVGLGTLFAVTFGAVTAGAEWSWGTLKVVVTRGESRTRYLLVKFAAVAVFLAIGLLIAMVVGALLAMLAARIAGTSTAGAGDTSILRPLAERLLRSWYALLEYAAIGFAISAVFRSQIAGIVGGIALSVFETIGALLVRTIAPYLPFRAASAVIGQDLEPGGAAASANPFLPQPLDLPVAVLVTALYIVAALVVASVVTERAEITG